MRIFLEFVRAVKLDLRCARAVKLPQASVPILEPKSCKKILRGMVISYQFSFIRLGTKSNVSSRRSGCIGQPLHWDRRRLACRERRQARKTSQLLQIRDALLALRARGRRDACGPSEEVDRYVGWANWVRDTR